MIHRRFVAPTKQCASTGEMRQLKIDSLDQNQLHSIEKIQNRLYLTLLNVKSFKFKFARLIGLTEEGRCGGASNAKGVRLHRPVDASPPALVPCP
jgi:hypothetical protein